MILINQATVNMTINIKVNMTVNMEVEMTFNTIDTKVNMIGIIKNLADTKTVGTNLKITDMMEEVASMEKDRMIIMVVVSIVRDKINTKEIIERIEIIDNLLKDNLDIINKKGMSRAGMKEEMIRNPPRNNRDNNRNDKYEKKQSNYDNYERRGDRDGARESARERRDSYKEYKD